MPMRLIANLTVIDLKSVPVQTEPVGILGLLAAFPAAFFEGGRAAFSGWACLSATVVS